MLSPTSPNATFAANTASTAAKTVKDVQAFCEQILAAPFANSDPLKTTQLFTDLPAFCRALFGSYANGR
jgi:hypothetical protein